LLDERRPADGPDAELPATVDLAVLHGDAGGKRSDLMAVEYHATREEHAHAEVAA